MPSEDARLRARDIASMGARPWPGRLARLRRSLPRDLGLRAPTLHALRIEIVLVAAVWLAVMVLAFYPGNFDGDTINMFHQGTSFDFNNWTSPLLSWLIGLCNAIVPGPGLAFLGTLALFAAGTMLIAAYFLRTGRPFTAQLTVLLLFFPIVIHELREVGKDTALAALAVFWLGVFLDRAQRRRAFSLIEMVVLAGLMVLLVDTRQNAMFAALPLLLLATWHAGARQWIWPGRVAGALLLLGLAYGTGQAFDRLVLDAYDMHPIVQLELFDIGGTTYFSGRDQSRGLLGPDFLERNKVCYTRQAWDSYVWGGCPEIGKRALADPPGKMFHAWLAAIASAPLAYLKHRLLHFLTFTRVLCQGVCGIPITSITWQQMAPAPFQRRPNPLSLAIEKIGVGFEISPLGRPWIWLLELLFCAAICGARLRRDASRIDALFGLCLAASGLLYGFGYLVVGIASVLRYAFWIFVSGILAPLFAWHAASAPDEEGGDASRSRCLTPLHRPQLAREAAQGRRHQP